MTSATFNLYRVNLASDSKHPSLVLKVSGIIQKQNRNNACELSTKV